LWVAAPKENPLDGEEENAENGEGLSLSLLLLPKAELAPPKIDGLLPLLLPAPKAIPPLPGAEGLPNTGGAALVDADADKVPNPPPGLLLLPTPPKEEDFPKTNPSPVDADDARAPNPPVAWLLFPPSPPNEGGFPKTGSSSLDDSEAGSVQNPPVALLPVPPKAEAPPLPKIDVDGFPPPLPRVEGLPKTGA
jgi:hypothetical protein